MHTLMLKLVEYIVLCIAVFGRYTGPKKITHKLLYEIQVVYNAAAPAQL